MDDFFGDDEGNVSDPDVASEDEPRGDISTGVERGEACADADTHSDARLITSPSMFEGEPETHLGTQVDNFRFRPHLSRELGGREETEVCSAARESRLGWTSWRTATHACAEPAPAHGMP